MKKTLNIIFVFLFASVFLSYAKVNGVKKLKIDLPRISEQKGKPDISNK